MMVNSNLEKTLDVEGHAIRLEVEASGVFSRLSTSSLPGTIAIVRLPSQIVPIIRGELTFSINPCFSSWCSSSWNSAHSARDAITCQPRTQIFSEFAPS